jgi:hypothetical protein
MLTRSRAARRLAVVLLFVLGLLGAACGDSDSDGGEGLFQTFAAAAETTGSAGSAHMTLEMRLEDVPNADGFSVVTDGETSMDGTTARFTISQLGQELESLIVDETYYFKIPGLPDGKTWTRMTFDDYEEMTGLDVGAAASQKPTDALARLSASGDIDEVGDEEVDGVPTTHYRAIVDLDAANAQMGFASEEALEQTKKLVGDSYPIDVWIDEDGYMRRMIFVIDLAEAPDPPAGLSTGRIITEMTMSDFGAPLDVQAPPDDEVIDFSEIN